MRNFIHFFGTTGDKDIFFKNIRKCGGLYLNINDTKIILDPGVSTFNSYINKYDDIIDGIILSHIHIDHSNDLNIFVEFMTNGGKEKRGTLILPNQAIEERTIQPYLIDFPEKKYITKPNNKYKIKDIEITSSIEHRHGMENYGFRIETKDVKLGIITDTRYFPELIESYIGLDTLIINVPYNTGIKDTSKHLDIYAVEEFIKNIKPQKVILTHFSKDMLNDNPDKIANKLCEKYNIEVIAAKDDMIMYI